MIPSLSKVRTFLSGRRKANRLNTTSFQKTHWAEEIQKHDWDAAQCYGYDWGDPEKSEQRLGNYKAIKDRMEELITSETVVLDLGSLGGKWVQFFLKAKEIVCVDINEVGFDYLKKKFPGKPLRFYLSKGNELSGIADASIDLVFSMDTLVRVERSHIKAYFPEISRVLKPGGRMLLHLPCNEVKGSRDKGFTSLGIKEIRQWTEAQGLKIEALRTDLLWHGAFVEARKK